MKPEIQPHQLDKDGHLHPVYCLLTVWQHRETGQYRHLRYYHDWLVLNRNGEQLLLQPGTKAFDAIEDADEWRLLENID